MCGRSTGFCCGPSRASIAERALRALLKTALRRFGLRCLSVEEVPQAAGELGPCQERNQGAG